MGNYMEISNQLVPVNVKAVPQTQSKPTVKKQDNEDKTEQIIVGLTGAAAVAIAGIALAKTGKGKELLGKLKNIGKDKADDVAAIVKDKADDVAAVVKDKADDVAAVVKERADDAAASLANGENYAKVKDQAIKNLSHDAKKQVKEKALKPGLDLRRVEEASQKQQAIQQAKTAAKSHGTIKSVSQGTKNASADKVIQNLEAAKTAAADSKKVALEKAEIAKLQGTRKSIKTATYYANQAEKDARELKKLEEKSAKRLEQIAQETAKKAANKAEQASHMTAESKQKMAETAKKAAENKLKREAKREASRPGIQRAYAKYKNYTKEQLEHLLRSPKTQAADKKVAQALLDNILKHS